MLILDAGDLLFKRYSGPVPENEIKMVTEKAKLIIDSLNLMGYDVLAIGDDDLSLGKEFLLEMSGRANFPFLSSNIIDEATGKPVFQTSLIKRSNGLRIGIFSLLAPDTFPNPYDLRRKGLTLRSPTETAQAMVKELQPKTDLIILLSHLGYPKDVELAQAVSGINFIVGGHIGVNLSYPPVLKNTLIVQTAPKGMYGARLDLVFYNHEPTFYNSMTRKSLENNLNTVRNRLTSTEAPEAEKAQWKRAKEETERTLGQLQGKNEFTFTISPLHEQMKDHPDIQRLVDAFKAQFPVVEKPLPPR